MMTEREKMIEAINSVQAYGIMSNAFGGDLPVTNEMLADALIAAGIGDVHKCETLCKVLHEQMMENMREERHRAQVAENELKLYKLAVKIWQERYSDIRCFNFNIALRQAEKELVEERKDD